jgi:hypothetical protein
MNATFAQHPLSAAFPAMDADGFDALKDSIEDIGVQSPVVLFDGMVIDGWHRYRAAREIGASCPVIDLPCDVDPRAYVLAQNRARRHLTASQIALVVATVHGWAPAHRPVLGKSVPGTDLPKTASELAEIAGVGLSTIERAKAVLRSGSPEVQAAVQAGEVSVKRAAEIAKRPMEEQAQALKTDPHMTRSSAHGTADDAPEREDVHQRIEDMARELADAVADNESMARVFEANDQISAALAEAKRYREENRILNERIRGLQNELNAAKRQAKYWQRMAEGVKA